MEFREKLQKLRKQRGLTQEELAGALYVSRTAVSKWESGRGYPSLDSLKAIAAFFSVTVDELLAAGETKPAETEKAGAARRRIAFAALDCAAVLLLFLPLFGQETAGTVRSVPLLTLTGLAPYLKAAYAAAAVALTGMGILSLILRDRPGFWARNGQRLSLLLNAAGTLLFMMGRQPYAAVFLFLCLAVKVLMTAKTP